MILKRKKQISSIEFSKWRKKPQASKIFVSVKVTQKANIATIA
jgi:hypothetical protein